MRSEVKNASIKHRCKQGRLKSRANGQPLLHTKYVRFCFHSKTQILRIWKSADLFVAAHHYSGARQAHALTITLSISFRKKHGRNNHLLPEATLNSAGIIMICLVLRQLAGGKRNPHESKVVINWIN